VIKRYKEWKRNGEEPKRRRGTIEKVKIWIRTMKNKKSLC
jgi:hypothetical protein